MPLAVVVGCNHGLQPAHSVDNGTDIATKAINQRKAFATDLKALIQRHKVEVIGEEWPIPVNGANDETIALRLSKTLEIQFVQVDIVEKDRPSHGISPARYKDRVDDETKRKFDGIREKHFVDTLIDFNSERNNVLLLCGTDHLEGTVKLLNEAGYTTELVNINQCDWFDETVFGD